MAIHPHLPGFAALGMVYFVPPGGDGNGESSSDGCWDQWSGGHQVLLGRRAGVHPTPTLNIVTTWKDSGDSKSQCSWDGRQYTSNLQLNTGKPRTYCELEQLPAGNRERNRTGSWPSEFMAKDRSHGRSLQYQAANVQCQAGCPRRAVGTQAGWW